MQVVLEDGVAHTISQRGFHLIHYVYYQTIQIMIHII